MAWRGFSCPPRGGVRRVLRRWAPPVCASAAALAAAFAFTPAPAPASEAPAAQAPRIIGLRHVEGRTRVALRLPRATGFEVFALADPPRLVVAFDAPAWEGAPPPPVPAVAKNRDEDLLRHGRHRRRRCMRSRRSVLLFILCTGTRFITFDVVCYF